MRIQSVAVAALGAIALSACTEQGADTAPPALEPITAAQVDGEAIGAADQRPGVWLSHGRTYSEQRFSPLEQVNASNISQLGLTWTEELDTMRGMESTPIVVDGVMYVTSAWSVVYALDARTGERLWKFDPEVNKARGVYACCDVVNRGVAIWNGKLFVGTIDGRLIALDAASGAPVWETVTVDQSRPYTITGAPRVVKGKVLIGNGGAELGVRGYVTAYDAETGEQAWRFFTTPNADKQPDGAASDAVFAELANETWDDEGAWRDTGGGGTAWDAMAYDPELDILYIGVGNGTPWNRRLRSPSGGDNLFLSSILALKPDTGEYVWHYQTTPGETWDYTATQHIILADLEIDGATRKVAMQAPKNGFFYVLDRETGELLSGDMYQPVTWASGIDTATGRPIETTNARYDAEPQLTYPGPLGSHNWHPMAFSPDTGLVYIPAHTLPAIYADDETFTYRPGFWNTGTSSLPGALPGDRDERMQVVKDLNISGQLVAWDPVAKAPRWTVDYPSPWNGGVLATAGNLVFQGGIDAKFRAYNAETGDTVWESSAMYPALSGPVSYELDGEQYIAVTAGWGTVLPLLGDFGIPATGLQERGMVLVFKLGGTAEIEEYEPFPMENVPAGDQFGSEQVIARGKEVYYANCMVCHGEAVVSGGVIQDLRWAQVPGSREDFAEVVLNGRYESAGMVSFADVMTEDDAEAVRAYILQRAHEDADPQ